MNTLIKNLAIILFICVLFPQRIAATDIQNADDYIIHLTDGSYITVELTVQQSRALSMVTGSKSYIYIAIATERNSGVRC